MPGTSKLIGSFVALISVFFLVPKILGQGEYPVVIPQQLPTGQIIWVQVVPGQNPQNQNPLLGHGRPQFGNPGNNYPAPPHGQGQEYPPGAEHGDGQNYDTYPQSQSPHSDSYRSGTEKHGYPPYCVDTGDEIEQTQCKYMLTISHPRSKDLVHFKMSRVMDKDFGYVAVGLSKDKIMDDDHIVECVKSTRSPHPTIFHSWSEYHSRPVRLADDANLILNKRERFDPNTKVLTCEFDRPVISEVTYYPSKSKYKPMKTIIDLKYPYTILMAVGETEKPESDNLGMHAPRQSNQVAIFQRGAYRSSGNANEGFTRNSLKFVTIMLICLFAKNVL